jgi:hypothetical protein
MPNPEISPDPDLSSIDRPSCTKREGPMLFTDVVLGTPDSDMRTFECIAADEIEKLPVKTNVMSWINSSGLRPPT